jgi:LVIVD repeat
LRVVDITDPDVPVVVATRVAPHAHDVALKDDVAFVASFAGELYVFDIANPTNPVQIKVLGLPAWKTPGPDAQGLQKLNAYVAAGNAKASGVVVRGDVLLTTDWAYGRIYYYDVSTPASPIFKGTHYVPYVLKVDIDVDRGVVFMLSAYGPASGIYTVPISSLSPNTSTAHATCPVCGYVPSTVPFVGLDQGGLALGEGGAYLVYGGGRNTGEFNVVDVRDPLAMANVATTEVGTHGVVVGAVMGVRIEGDRAFFAAGQQGVQIYQFPGLSGAGGPPPPDTPPTILSFALNSGASSTANRMVTLNNAVSGNPAEYRAGETSNLSSAPWLPYAPRAELLAHRGEREQAGVLPGARRRPAGVRGGQRHHRAQRARAHGDPVRPQRRREHDDQPHGLPEQHGLEQPDGVPRQRGGRLRRRRLAVVRHGADLPAQPGQRHETGVLSGPESGRSLSGPQRHHQPRRAGPCIEHLRHQRRGGEHDEPDRHPQPRRQRRTHRVPCQRVVDVRGRRLGCRTFRRRPSR